jgi:mRNA interferase MazF
MIKRGHIYFVNLNPTHGREQTGYRPVLVVSSDAINCQPLVVTVVVGTDARNVQRDYPTNVRVMADETGLPLDTVFLCFQLRSLDHSRFMNPVTQQPNLAGKLPESRMADVDKALRMTMSLDLPAT